MAPFDATFCRSCAEGVLGGTMPNCGGEFVPRPRRGRRSWLSSRVDRARLQAPGLPLSLDRRRGRSARPRSRRDGNRTTPNGRPLGQGREREERRHPPRKKSGQAHEEMLGPPMDIALGSTHGIRPIEPAVMACWRRGAASRGAPAAARRSHGRDEARHARSETTTSSWPSTISSNSSLPPEAGRA